MYFSSLEMICMHISFCNKSLLLETTRLVLGGSSISASYSAVICPTTTQRELYKRRPMEGKWAKMKDSQWYHQRRSFVWSSPFDMTFFRQHGADVFCITLSVGPVFTGQGFYWQPCVQQVWSPAMWLNQTGNTWLLFPLKCWWVSNTPSKKTKPLWFQPKNTLCILNTESSVICIKSVMLHK